MKDTDGLSVFAFITFTIIYVAYFFVGPLAKGVPHLIDAIKIQVAPRLYLIEYMSDLVN
jgi:hypothetical protein